jgi:alpha-D-ribose 1-methylphosphonate 5-triphosphate diphosphatase
MLLSTYLTNARLVLPQTILHGALTLIDGRIQDIGAPTQTGLDLEGDFLLPGLIDLHTDNLERQVLPRANARWPSRSALLAHDAQCAAAGITTVFDALCIGDIGFEKARLQTFKDGMEDIQEFAAAGILKAEHFLHLRCELPAAEMPNLLATAIDEPLVRLISLMNHSPGIGQYADIGRYQQMRASDGFSNAEIQTMVADLQASHHRHTADNRQLGLALARTKNIPLASHDDRTEAEVLQNHHDGITISEFPVSFEAARTAKAKNMRVVAGAPNIVRGGSHSGNVSALALVQENLVDALASDYVPAAMAEAVFYLSAQNVLPLPEAVALATSGPADIAGLHDRGRIAPRQRADLVQVRLHGSHPVIRAVWRAGIRIA